MKSLKMLALIGVSATFVTAHNHEHNGTHHDGPRDGSHGPHHGHHGPRGDGDHSSLRQKVEFLESCSAEVSLCEKQIAEAQKNFVVVDPTKPVDPQPPFDPVDPPPTVPVAPERISDVVRQCIMDTLEVCVPTVMTNDPVAIVKCVVENREEIIETLTESQVCEQAFNDLISAHGRNRRHGHGDHDDDDDDDSVGHHRNHGDHDDDDDDDSDSHSGRHLSAPGADIGTCLLKQQNLTAPCQQAMKMVNATTSDWSFLDAEGEHKGKHHKFSLRHHWPQLLALLAFLMVLGCCVRRCYKEYCTRTLRPVTPVGFPGSAIPNSPQHTQAPVTVSYSAGSDNAYVGRPAIQTPSRPVDFEYTGTGDVFLAPGTVASDQYV